MTTDELPPNPATRPHLAPVPEEPPFEDPYDSQPRHNPNTPPHDLQAEQAVLGAMLISPQAITDATELITPADHYRPIHETIHTAITAVHATGTPVDLVTVGRELAARGDLIKVGGAPYLHTLIATVPIVSNASYYAEIVLEKSKLRRLLALGQRMVQSAQSGNIAGAEQAIGDIVDDVNTTAMRFTAGTTGHATGLVDLSWILTGQAPVQEPPCWTHRSDGIALFYAAKVNGIFGDPEAAKTWLAMTAGIEAMKGHGTFAILDVDHNGADATVAKLLLLGARPDDLANPDRFRYYEPHDSHELLGAVDDIANRRTDVVILDSLGEIFPMLGVSTNDGDEMTTAMRRVCMTLADASCAVITIDHLPKGQDARQSGFAIGTIAKKRMIRGSYIRAEVRTQPAPGQTGRITLRIEKDPSGQLRKHTPGGYAGTFVLDSTNSETQGVTLWSIEREDTPKNDDGTLRLTHLMEKVSRYVEQNDQCSQTMIEKAKLGKAQYVRAALQTLIQDGHIVPIAGPRNATLHHTVSMYREAEDDIA